jgi:hypothetical protein
MHIIAPSLVQQPTFPSSTSIVHSLDWQIALRSGYQRYGSVLMYFVYSSRYVQVALLSLHRGSREHLELNHYGLDQHLLIYTARCAADVLNY